MLPEQDKLIEDLHRAYSIKLTLYAASALKDGDRAQEIVQDAFHEAILHIDTLMDHENPGGWLKETVKYKVKESERARRRYLHRVFSLDTDFAAELFPLNELAAEMREPDEILPMERIEQVLTPEEFRLLKRLTLDKASHFEMARELGISVYASQKRLERIREKLYKLYPERKKKK